MMPSWLSTNTRDFIGWRGARRNELTLSDTRGIVLLLLLVNSRHGFCEDNSS